MLEYNSAASEASKASRAERSDAICSDAMRCDARRAGVEANGLVSLLYDIRYLALACPMASVRGFVKRLEAEYMMFDAIIDVKALREVVCGDG